MYNSDVFCTGVHCGSDEPELLERPCETVFFNGGAYQIADLLQLWASIVHTDGIPDCLDHFEVVHAVTEPDCVLDADPEGLGDDPDATAFVKSAVDQLAVETLVRGNILNDKVVILFQGLACRLQLLHFLARIPA